MSISPKSFETRQQEAGPVLASTSQPQVNIGQYLLIQAVRPLQCYDCIKCLPCTCLTHHKLESIVGDFVCLDSLLGPSALGSLQSSCDCVSPTQASATTFTLCPVYDGLLLCPKAVHWSLHTSRKA